MSSSHFDAIAAAYDESLPAHVVEHYLRKRVALRARATARAAAASTSAAAPACSRRGWRPPGSR